MASALDELPVYMMTPSRSIMRLASWRAASVGLGVALDPLHFLAKNAVALEAGGLQRLQHAAALVQVLNGKLGSAQFVSAFVGIGAGLRDGEAQSNRRALGAGREVADRLVVLRPGAAHEAERRDAREGERACAGDRPLQDRAPRETFRAFGTVISHVSSPLFLRRSDCGRRASASLSGMVRAILGGNNSPMVVGDGA
jgi:hypothetical protein